MKTRSCVLLTLVLVIGACSGNKEARQWTHYSPTKVASARDSYVKAVEHAGTLKGGPGEVKSEGTSLSQYYTAGQPSSAYYYHLYPNSEAKYYGYSNKQHMVENDLDTKFLPPFYEEEADSKTDPGTIAGIAGAAIASLSSLSWIGTAAVVIILAPIIIPVVIAPLLFFGVILYFLPVIRLDLGETTGTTSERALGRNLRSALTHLDATARFLSQVSQNEECVERVTCEVARMARGNPLESWINSKLEAYKSGWVSRVSRSYRTAKSGADCKVYSCNPMRQFRRVMRSFGSRTRT